MNRHTRSLMFFLLLAPALFSQQGEALLVEQLHQLMKARVSWKKLSHQAVAAEEKQQVASCIADSANAFCLDPRIDGDYVDDFHLLDLDGDKDLDLIYEGFECAGMSTRTVLVYFNEQGRLRRALASPGRLSVLKPGKELILYKYPCCSSTFNTLIRYRIQPDSLLRETGIHFFYSPLLDGMEIAPEQVLPKKPKRRAQYEVLKGFPVYAISEVYFDRGSSYNSDPIGYIHTNAVVGAYGSYTDLKGEQWLCVLADPRYLSLNRLACEFPALVWVNQSNVKLIDPVK